MLRKYLLAVVLFLFCICNYGQSQSFNFEYGGTLRTYLLHLPASYDGSVKVPLIIAYHGKYRSETLMEEHTRFSAKSDSAGFIIVYPRGTGNPIEWNDDNSGSSDDLGFSIALIDTLIKNYSIDENRIFVTGFSDGAGMAFRMSFNFPEKIAAVGGVCWGLYGSQYNITKPVPSIQIYSKNDGSFSSANAKQAIDFWTSFNTGVTGPDIIFTNSGATGIKYTTDNPGIEFVQYSTKTGGHSWAGGGTSWATPSTAISATDLIWDFFELHPMTVTSVKQNETNTANDFHLFQNYPNPFNPSTTIGYQIPVAGFVILKIYNLLGEEVTTLVNNMQKSGAQYVKFDASGLSSGVYFYRISVRSDNGKLFTKTAKMMLTK